MSLLSIFKSCVSCAIDATANYVPKTIPPWALIKTRPVRLSLPTPPRSPRNSVQPTQRTQVNYGRKPAAYRRSRAPSARSGRSMQRNAPANSTVRHTGAPNSRNNLPRAIYMVFLWFSPAHGPGAPPRVWHSICLIRVRCRPWCQSAERLCLWKQTACPNVANQHTYGTLRTVTNRHVIRTEQ